MVKKKRLVEAFVSKKKDEYCNKHTTKFLVIKAVRGFNAIEADYKDKHLPLEGRVNKVMIKNVLFL